MEGPDGGLMPLEMNPLNWLQSRVDVIDVETCTLLASHVQDALFLGIVEDGLVADGEISPEGAPLINISRIELRQGAQAGDAKTP